MLMEKPRRSYTLNFVLIPIRRTSTSEVYSAQLDTSLGFAEESHFRPKADEMSLKFFSPCLKSLPVASSGFHLFISMASICTR